MKFTGVAGRLGMNANIRQALAPVAETGVADSLLFTELHGRQTAVTLLLNQDLPLFRGAVLSHGDNLVLKNVRLL